MATVHDVAKYILQETGEISAMKLQKLVYYSQAWHLAWDDEPLFGERIEAWANGPVAPELYAQHKGQFSVTPPWSKGDASALSPTQRESINSVLDSYGKMSARQLSHLTHAEDPWRIARRGVPDGERSTNEITTASMSEYYGALDASDEAQAISDLLLDESYADFEASPHQ